MKSKKTIIPLTLVAAIWLCLCVLCVALPKKTESEAERRKLQTMPELNIQSLISTNFMTDFEKFTLDTFPGHDLFRGLKSAVSYYVLNLKDNNGIYINNGYAAKLEYPLNENSVLSATQKFEALYSEYIKDSGANVYMCVVPDKSYYLANGKYLQLDYEKLFDIVKNNMLFAQYIDITNTLNKESYYKTDTHWRQEKITATAEKILSAMGAAPFTDYTQITATTDFYGVYYGQAALPFASDTLNYLTNDAISSMITKNFETQKTMGVYNTDKLNSRDPYEVFMSGAVPIITIDNPSAVYKKELIIFRDSFASSISPLLAAGYSKVTLIDTRYITSDLIGSYVEFTGQDVLFLYSTLILNNSSTLR